MADSIIPTINLAARIPKGRELVTVTATDEVTVFITDEVTVYVTDTVEVTTSIFDTSYITMTNTVTDTFTTTKSFTTTATQSLIPTTAHPTTTENETLRILPFPGTTDSSTSQLPLPTHFCTTLLAPTHVGKHLDPFEVLSIVFGVFILFLLALMWLLVRRFYKMYRAERVLRKQMQTERTGMPSTKMAANGGETFVVGEE